MTAQISLLANQSARYIGHKPKPYNKLLLLLYIQINISFLIGQKRTVYFRNQRLGRHLAADYTIIMSRTLRKLFVVNIHCPILNV